MRPYFLLLMLLSLLSANIQAQQTAANQVAMQQPVIGLFDALAELDVNKARSYCTADVSILETGAIWNFDSLAQRITTRKEKATGFKRINKIDFIETRVFNDIAWISYFNTAIITINNKTVQVKWLESVVIKRDKGEWKISLLHSTELERN